MLEETDHRALPFLQAGAYSLLNLPPGALWGERRASNGCKHVFLRPSTGAQNENPFH
ncbi:MAG: hypothetical protein ACYCWB_09305 [Thiobacillus sp.]